ncbi:hypothetical protein ACFE04_017540 [Oxalis oulophora]
MVKPKLLYQAWPAKNIFIFGGRIIFGPDAKAILITALLILVPITIFCASIARNLVREFQAYNAGLGILVLAIAFTICVLVLLLLTSAGDPGIVPRNSRPPEEEMVYDSSASIEPGRETPVPRLPRTKECVITVLRGLIIIALGLANVLERSPENWENWKRDSCSFPFSAFGKLEYSKCSPKVAARPPEVIRNYRYFFLFISSSTLLCLYIFAMSALHLKFEIDYHGTLWKAIKESPVSVILMIYCFIFLWFVGGLTCFHLYLIATNQTTYENFRFRAAGQSRTFDRGCLNNFREVLCTKSKPSKMNFHSYVLDDTPRHPPRRRASKAKFDIPEGERREKVEDDSEIGVDFLKISQRRDIEDPEMQG